MSATDTKTKATWGFMGVILLMVILQTCNSCGTSSQLSKANRRLDAIDSTVSTKPSRAETERIIKVEGLRISKRNLYDQNAIVRTTIRPDDRMNEYDSEIDSLSRADK